MKLPLAKFIIGLRKIQMPADSRYEVLDLALELANGSIVQATQISNDVIKATKRKAPQKPE